MSDAYCGDTDHGGQQGLRVTSCQQVNWRCCQVRLFNYLGREDVLAHPGTWVCPHSDIPSHLIGILRPRKAVVLSGSNFSDACERDPVPRVMRDALAGRRLRFMLKVNFRDPDSPC
jgi:hypothetical protein